MDTCHSNDNSSKYEIFRSELGGGRNILNTLFLSISIARHREQGVRILRRKVQDTCLSHVAGRCNFYLEKSSKHVMVHVVNQALSRFVEMPMSASLPILCVAMSKRTRNARGDGALNSQVPTSRAT